MNTIFNQDARDRLCDEGFASLVVTSPPYFNLVDYKVDGQIGFESSWASYVQSLTQVWENIIRYLTPKGTVCINIGCALEISRKNQNQLFDIRSSILEFFFSNGFYLKGDIIWDLNNPKYRDRQVKRFYSVYPDEKAIVLNDYEHVLVFGRLGEFQAMTAQSVESTTCVSGIWRIPWDYETFPPRLANPLVERLIELFSEPSTVVFDPFMGLGTVAESAYFLGRKFCGTELNYDTYCRCLRNLRSKNIQVDEPVQKREETDELSSAN